MQVYIIHRNTRTDRIPNIAKLLGAFPQAKILEAKVPMWEHNLHSRAMRGCLVSHLSAVKSFLSNEPILVLEDDAVLHPEAWAKYQKSELPKDAHIVLLGADVECFGDEGTGGFRPALPKFWGTHAVMYYPSLMRTQFLLNAFEAAATVNIADSQNNGVCCESIMMQAAGRAGLPIYRPHEMVFSTAESVSDSSGIVMPIRNKAWIAKERDSLLPHEAYAAIFEPWRGKRAHLLSVPGNPGDMLINAATRQLWRSYGIIETQDISQADVVMYPGGGNIGGQYNFKDQYRAFEKTTKPKIVLPQSLLKPDPYAELADQVFVRDEESLKIMPRAILMPDLSLAYRTSIKLDAVQEQGIFFRTDAEKKEVPPNNMGDPARSPNHYSYLQKASGFKSLHTNRLHFAVAGLIVGSKVTLYPNNYHKNRSVFLANLQKLGCNWQDSFAQV